MPKKLTKLLKLSGKKKGDGDSVSISSKASAQGPSEVDAVQIFSYTIKKDKELPKLHKAAWHGNVTKVKELAKPSAVNTLDKKNRTPLHLACAQGDVNIATHLLSCKAKVNLCDVDGRTALMKAVDSNHCDCAKLLLDANGDPNIADGNGLTPLHIAAHRGAKDVATLLLERDARIGAIDKNGSSPLHYATLQGHNEFISFLIQEGIDVNCTDGKGHTPLMLAAAEGRIGIIKVLLQSKPNTDLRDEYGCTAADHAIINNNNSIVQLIKDYQSSSVKPLKHTGKHNSMLIEEPKLALGGSNFRGPAIDNTDDLNDTKTEDTSTKRDVASHNSWSSNEDSSQALPASNRGPSLLAALKLTTRDHNLVQPLKGHSSASHQSAVSSEGNPLISKPILHSASQPPTASNHPQQQQTLPKGKKVSEQSIEDYQLDSFDDSDSESNGGDKPMAAVFNSTPSVTDKKLPGLSFSFDKAPFIAQPTLPEEKETEIQASNSKVSATEVTSALADIPATKETEGLATEKLENFSVKKEEISSDFDSSPPISMAEDDYHKQFSSDSEEDDDFPATAYVPSVGIGLAKRSHNNPLTGHPQQLTTTEKEKDKILELAHSSLLEMEETSKKSGSPKIDLDKAAESKDTVDGSSPSHNLGTFSPITPLPDQTDAPSMFPNDVKPTNTKVLGNSVTTNHGVGIMSPLSGSDSSLDTDSVIRQAEEIECSVENPTSNDHGVQSNTKLKSATTVGHGKSDKQQTEGSDWDEDDDSTSKTDSRDEEHNALAGLGKCGLPDPFGSHLKYGSKRSASKSVDYFNMYGSDSSEDDDNIEKLLSPEKHDSAVEDDDEVEFVNPLLDDKDELPTTVEESESEWEKELKLKRDQKAVDQRSTVTPNQPTIPVVDEKQTPSVDDKQLSPTDDSSISEALTNEPSGHAHSDNNKEQLLLQNNNNKATRSLKDDTDIQDDKIGDKHPPASSKETSSTLPLSPNTIKDMEATRRYEQKQNELLLVLEGRRKQVENTRRDTSDRPPAKSSTRVDEELAHIRRPSVDMLRSTWEGQQQVSSLSLPSKSSKKVELEPLKSSPRSLSEMDNSNDLLNKGNDVTDVVATTKDQALLQQSSPVLAKASESNKVLFSEEESDALPHNAITHLESSAILDATSQLASLELEKLTGTVNSDKQKQRSFLSPHDHSEQSFSSNKSVEQQYKSSLLATAEKTELDKQFQQENGQVEGQDNSEGVQHEEHVANPTGDMMVTPQSDQGTTPTNERITDENGAQKHPADDSDDMLLNGSISMSSQHTTTDLSATHSPIPFLSTSLPRPSTMAGYGRPTSSLLEWSGVSGLQENLRKTQRELERVQSAEAHAKTGKKRMEAQLKESYRKQSDLSTVKAQLEESKLDLEMANRSMKYQLEQETIVRKNAESLVDQFRQQLSKLEQQLRKEKESHQKTLSQKKEVELDHQTLLVSTQQLQEKLDDLQTRLQRERDSWKLQETLYNERLKVFQDIQEESSKSKERQAQVLTQLEESDVMRQSLIEKHSTLQQQLAQAQVQLSREQQQHEELQLQLTRELEAANCKLTTKSNSLVEAEKALLHLQQQFDSSLTELKSKAEMLSTRLDEEVASRQQAEAELSVMRTQHEKTNNELHAILKDKLQLEKEQHVKEQEYLRQTSLLERDLASSRENQQEMVEKLQSMEVKLASTENESKNLQSRLFEQANQVSIIQREADHNQKLLAATEEKLSRENELKIKLESQLTSASEKSTTSQSELVFLRAQLDVANKKITDKDAHSSETQDKFSSILENLKADHQQARNMLEEKLQSLRDQLMVSKEEIARSNLEKNSLSKEVLHLKQELERHTQEKLTLEKTLVQTKEMSTTDKVSQVDLQHQIQALNSKLVTSEGNVIASQNSCKELQEQLAEQQQQYDELQEELALTEQECAAINEEKLELEESVSLLTEEVEKHQNDLSKKDEQIVQLSTQMKHLQDVRSGLEQTTTSLRGEIHELELQLSNMTAARDRALTSAEESKGLWETEIKSRSQLGLKLMQLQKSHSDHTVLLDNEKRKARKALEIKKNVERKMEACQERNTLLQEELVLLRSQLKSTKKKFKEIETSESTVKAELDKTQQLLQSETDSLRAQLLKVSTELRTESLLRKEADNGVASLKRECEKSRSQLSLSKTELREKEKVHRQMEKANKKLKEDLNTLKEEVLRKYTPIGEMEAYRIQVEDKAKRELQAKLEEVNSHLEQQFTVQASLDKLRSETELQWQSRYEQTTEDLKYQLQKALAEIEELRVQRDTRDNEARRYKELFEVESQRREKLRNKLEMAREPTDHSSLGQRPPQHLLDNSLSSRNLHSFPTPSFSQPATSVPLKSSTNDLLSSVRQELDKSIAKHLESASSTTRPQLKHRHASQSAPRRDAARVTAIAQNYFV